MRRRLLVLASAVTALLRAAPARADAPASEPVLRQEWIGAEVAPLSLNQGSAPSDHPSRFQPGVGLQVRLLRHRWQRLYWTPVQGGLYYGSDLHDDWTILACLQTEAGGVLRIGDQVLELGLAAGGGLLAVRYGEINLISLGVGGSGWMVSPVVRYLFREARSHTLGVVARAQIPLTLPPSNSEFPVAYTDRGVLFLLAFDVGFGRDERAPM